MYRTTTLLKYLFLLLGALLLSTAAISQSATTNDDDDDDDEDFIILGRPGLKPDTTSKFPGCAEPDKGSFSLWIQVQMANMDEQNYPCDLVVKAELSEADNPDNNLTIYSNPLTFSCGESGFCRECPDATLCSTYALFTVPSSYFSSMCNGIEGEKLDINIEANVVFSCDGSIAQLHELGTEGCLGHLPESCFNITTDGSVRGEGCIVCPEETGPTEGPQTPKEEQGPGLRKKEGLDQIKAELLSFETSTANWILTNPVSDILDLSIPPTHSTETLIVKLVSQHGIVQLINLRGYKKSIDVSQLAPGVYYLIIQNGHSTYTVPWIKI